VFAVRPVAKHVNAVPTPTHPVTVPETGVTLITAKEASVHAPCATALVHVNNTEVAVFATVVIVATAFPAATVNEVPAVVTLLASVFAQTI